MYPVVVSAAGKDEKVGMRKGGKTKKRLSANRKTVFFYFISALREEKKQLPL